ncbi:MAG: hypothetical protein KGJ80_17960 [Chloroflexota bacterium]|nr:hypothetical protein [Chloroflexota bacterium]
MRNGLVLAGIAFAVALAVLVGNRLSNEAMAVVVGAVCGIGASVPVSLALVIAASRNWGREEAPRETGADYAARHYAPPPPQILVVSPPQANVTGYPFASAPYYLPPTIDAAPYGAREFKIIGDE